MRIDLRYVALAVWGFVSLAASPVLAAGKTVDTPYPDGGLEGACAGIYMDDHLGESCTMADGTTIECQWGNPYCQTTPPRPVNPNAGTVVAIPPAGGKTMASPAGAPAMPGSLSSPTSTGTAAGAGCQANPNCG